MAVESYPTGLPGPRVVQFSSREVSATRRNDTQIGPPVFELLSEDVPTFFTVSWLFSASAYQVFEGWFKWRLTKGSKAFNISLNVGKGYESHECHFTNSYQVSQIGKLFNVSAELITVAKQYDNEDHFEDLLIWEAGINAHDSYGLSQDIINFTNIDLPNAWQNIEYGTDYS